MNPNQTLTPSSFVVAERFNSVQGEGRWTGTPMHFIRLAGCNVGKRQQAGPFVMQLKTGESAAECCTYDGRPFQCDTDYFHGKVMSFELLANLTTERHVVFTGGEPVLHQDRILDFLNAYPQYECHVETSGTVPLHPQFAARSTWITCSPKRGFLEDVIHRADEIKLLIDPGFKLSDVPEVILNHHLVYVQPVNSELSVDQDNVKLCLDLLREMPHWNLSVQLHKFINVR